LEWSITPPEFRSTFLKKGLDEGRQRKKVDDGLIKREGRVMLQRKKIDKMI